MSHPHQSKRDGQHREAAGPPDPPGIRLRVRRCAAGDHPLPRSAAPAASPPCGRARVPRFSGGGVRVGGAAAAPAGAPRPGDLLLLHRLSQAFDRFNRRALRRRARRHSDPPLRPDAQPARRAERGHPDRAADRDRASAVATSRGTGGAEVEHTLLHEMVHQWQAETGLPVDHGPLFRREGAGGGSRGGGEANARNQRRCRSRKSSQRGLIGPAGWRRRSGGEIRWAYTDGRSDPVSSRSRPSDRQVFKAGSCAGPGCAPLPHPAFPVSLAQATSCRVDTVTEVPQRHGFCSRSLTASGNATRSAASQRSTTSRSTHAGPSHGRTGFTGTAPVRRLLGAGHQVVALDYKDGLQCNTLRAMGAEVVLGRSPTVPRCSTA